MLSPLFLTHCGTKDRQVTLITPFTVLSPSVDLSHAVIVPNVGLTELSELPGGLSNTLFCLQSDIRVNFFDQRPGFQPIFARVNLITRRDSSPQWNSPSSGAVGLDDALAWIRNSSNTFLASSLVMNLPKDSGGIIRIQGSFVRPITTAGQNPSLQCPKLDPQQTMPTPLETYTIWGETALTPGGPSQITLPINVVRSQPVSGGAPIAYGIPNITNGTITNPSSNASLKCRNPANKASCANRNLISFQISGNYTEKPLFSVSYGSNTLDGTIDHKFKVSSVNTEYLYLPKNPVFDLEYQKSSGSNGFITIKVRIEWSNKRYQFIDPVTSIQEDYEMLDCQNGTWGVKLPSATLTNAGPSTCNSALPNGANMIIQDLGLGFY